MPYIHLIAAAMDGISDEAALLSLFVFPWAVFRPVWGTVQLAMIFFVLIAILRRARRKHRRGDSVSGGWLVAQLLAGYLLATTLTNLTLFLIIELR